MQTATKDIWGRLPNLQELKYESRMKLKPYCVVLIPMADQYMSEYFRLTVEGKGKMSLNCTFKDHWHSRKPEKEDKQHGGGETDFREDTPQMCWREGICVMK